MVEEELEVFKNYLKTNMLLYASKSVKEIYELLSLETEESKEIYLERLFRIVNENNFKLELEIGGDLIRVTKWYRDGVRIMPLDGIIKPMSPNKKNNQRRNPIPASFRHEVFKRDGYRCLECGAINKDVSLEIDHIIPVSQGGTDELSNLQTLCKICNQAKSNRAWKAPENNWK